MKLPGCMYISDPGNGGLSRLLQMIGGVVTVIDATCLSSIPEIEGVLVFTDVNKASQHMQNVLIERCIEKSDIILHFTTSEYLDPVIACKCINL